MGPLLCFSPHFRHIWILVNHNIELELGTDGKRKAKVWSDIHVKFVLLFLRIETLNCIQIFLISLKNTGFLLVNSWNEGLWLVKGLTITQPAPGNTLGAVSAPSLVRITGKDCKKKNYRFGIFGFGIFFSPLVWLLLLLFLGTATGRKDWTCWE